MKSMLSWSFSGKKSSGNAFGAALNRIGFSGLEMYRNEALRSILAG